MGDGEAPVPCALRNHALGPEVHGQVRPVVVPGHKLLPALPALLLPGTVLGHQTPEGGEVDDDPVVEVRAPERRDACNLVPEGPELGDEGLLLGHLLALTRRGTRARRLHQGRQPALLVLQLRGHGVAEDPEEGVLAQAVGVEPDRVARRGRSKLPVDGRPAAALGVGPQVLLEEPPGEPGARLRAEQYRGLLPGVLRPGPERHLQPGAHGRGQVSGVPPVVHQHPVLGEREGIARGCPVERQPVVSSQHPRGAHRQGVEGLGLGWWDPLARGEPHVKASEGNAREPVEHLRDKLRGPRCRGQALGVLVLRLAHGLHAALAHLAFTTASGLRFGVAGCRASAAPAQDRRPVLGREAVQVEAAVVDLGLDLRECGPGFGHPRRVGRHPLGERRALRLEQRGQDKGVGGDPSGVERALQGPAPAGEAGQVVLGVRRQLGHRGALDDADLVGPERHLQRDEGTEGRAVRQRQQG